MNLFQDFWDAVAGDGQLTWLADGRAARLESTLTGSPNRATLYLEALAFPGVTYTLRFAARLLSGTGATAPFIAVDYPARASLVDRRPYSPDGEWRDYQVSFTAPFNADPASDLVVFGLGVFTAQSGAIEVASPVFSTDCAWPVLPEFPFMATMSGTANSDGDPVTFTPVVNSTIPFHSYTLASSNRVIRPPRMGRYEVAWSAILTSASSNDNPTLGLHLLLDGVDVAKANRHRPGTATNVRVPAGLSSVTLDLDRASQLTMNLKGNGTPFQLAAPSDELNNIITIKRIGWTP